MPLAQSWIDLEKRTGRWLFRGTPEDIKQQDKEYARFLQPLYPKPSDAVQTKEGDAEGVKYRIYSPTNASELLPIAVWTHGGGFIIGDLDQDDYLCRQVCEKTVSIVVSVDYSLVPKARWPTQCNEVLSVYRWAYENASAIGGDSNRMFTIGGSAGGQLALTVCNRVLKSPALRDSIKGVVAIAPVTCPPNNCPEQYRSRYTSYRDNAIDVPVLDAESMQICLREIGQREDDPDFWILLAADDHKNFPPVYMTSSEMDPLRDDAKVLLEALEKVGVPTRHDYYPGLPHYFWMFPILPESPVFIANLLAGVRWLHSLM